MDGDDDETLHRVEHGEEDLGDEERWELLGDTGFQFFSIFRLREADALKYLAIYLGHILRTGY